MSNLRKKLSAGGPGLMIAIIAIITALAGTAYAATKLNNTQKKEVEKIAKKYVAKPGAPGAQGQTGPPGVKGDTGSQGGKGDQGIPGLKGTDGKSVELVGEGAELCEMSPTEKVPGVAYEIEGSGIENTVCDGAEGSPWTAGGILPSGATETGKWTLTGTTANTGGVNIALSFPIQLKEALDETHVHYFSEGNFTTFCKGNGSVPAPIPGNLCVYLTESVNEVVFNGIYSNFEEGEKGSLRMGAVLAFSTPTGVASGGGSFAFTAP
jgi:hypothetical protein